MVVIRMAEDENVTLGSQDLGEIVVAPEVIEVIIGIAVSKVEGVHGMQSTFASNITERLGRQTYGKGINLSNDDDGNLFADIYAYLDYGVVVPKVAIEMQAKVKQQVLSMTGLELKEVNIHVVSIVPEKSEKIVTTDLFADDDEE